MPAYRVCEVVSVLEAGSEGVAFLCSHGRIRSVLQEHSNVCYSGVCEIPRIDLIELRFDDNGKRIG